MYLPGMNADCSSLTKCGRNFFSLVANSLLVTLKSTFKRLIGRHALSMRKSLPGFSITVITACFWLVVSSPT